MNRDNEFDFYIASCTETGGIYKCRFEKNRAEIKEKILLDKPMYMLKNDSCMHVLLCAPFGSDESGIVKIDLETKKISPAKRTGGVVACHLCMSDDEIYVVNYRSGNVVKLPDKIVQHSGSSVNLRRQDKPHTHFICPTYDGKYLLSTDLGTDEIYVYDKNLNEVSRIKMPDGKGPRHLACTENTVYCVNELSSDVSVLEYNDARLTLLDTYSALPEKVEGNTAAAIRIKDGLLYVSNRGHNSISVFEIDAQRLKLTENVPCGGNSPRDFDIFGNILICTNESSNNVTFFETGKASLKKLDTMLEIPSPLCVVR